MNNLVKAVLINIILITIVYIIFFKINDSTDARSQEISEKINKVEDQPEIMKAVNIESVQKKVEKIDQPKEEEKLVQQETMMTVAEDVPSIVQQENEKQETIETAESLGNTGQLQEGEILPSLELTTMSEELISKLIDQGKAYLIVTIQEQRYLIHKDNNNTYENATLTQLSKVANLSQRYSTLTRQQIRPEDLDNLDNQVYMSTRIESTPEYSLVFSVEYSAYITSVQLQEVRDCEIDLQKLKQENKYVYMRGLIKEDLMLNMLEVKIE